MPGWPSPSTRPPASSKWSVPGATRTPARSHPAVLHVGSPVRIAGPVDPTAGSVNEPEAEVVGIMVQRLEGKVAVITGTGGAQGRAAALLFAREGARIVGCDLKAEASEETAELV